MIQTFKNVFVRFGVAKRPPNEPSVTSWTFTSPTNYTERRSRRFYRSCGQALMGNTHLRELTLEQFEVEKIKDAQFLAQCIAQTKIQSLTIAYMRFHDYPVIMSMFFCEVFNTSSSLTTLSLEGYDGNNFLRFFSYPHELVLLARALSRNTNIKRLLFRCCGLFYARSMEILFAEGLRHNRTITELELSRCQIDDDGVRSMVEHWNPDSPITKMSLAGNRIGPTGAQMLMQAARDHPALKSLNLDNNESMGAHGLRMIGQELVTQPHLTHIYLSSQVNHSGTPPTEDQMNTIIQAGQALLEAVKTNQRIQVLDVQLNLLPRYIENEIYYYSRLNRIDRDLLSASHRLTDAVWPYVLARCYECDSIVDGHLGSSVVFFYLREQPHLVRLFPLSSQN